MRPNSNSYNWSVNMSFPASILKKFATDNNLPGAFLECATDYYLPLAEWVHRQHGGGRCKVIGVSGAQGTGKTTLAELLQSLLSEAYGHRVVSLSIDDFYLTRGQRARLAGDVHPLLATRGVPGTHDVDLGCKLLKSLVGLKEGEILQVPRFDKLADDRRARDNWDNITGPVDIVLLEGWCVGSAPQPAEDLIEPVNSLESDLDPDGRWRRYVNRQLEEAYPRLFSFLDALVFLQAPDIGSIRRWRIEQERRLADTATTGGKDLVMSDEDVHRFVQNFERVTLSNMQTLPQLADVIFRLNRDHGVDSADYKRK
jgi:D-glycerate 3-kinase